jgi:hypothetical protein
MLIRFSCLSFQRQACCMHIVHNELETLLHIKNLEWKFEIQIYCSKGCAVVKGFEAKVQVYGVELVKDVLVTS